MKRWLRVVLVLIPFLLFAFPTQAGADARHADLQFVDQMRVVTMTVPSQACRTGRTHITSCNWELFVDEPDEPGQPIVGTAAGTSGVLTVPYPSNFCGLLQADVLVGTPLRKKVGRRHEISSCACPSPGVPTWPSSVTGISHVRPHAVEGLYLSELDNVWTLYATHPGGAEQVFTGTITTNGTVTGLQPLRLEGHDSIAQVAANEIQFRFVNRGYLDGLSFAPACGSQVTFDTSINGSPAPPSHVFLGPTRVPASSSPVTFVRTN